MLDAMLEPKWTSSSKTLNSPHPLTTWFCKQFSLSEGFKKLTPTINLKLLTQTISTPTKDAAQRLDLSKTDEIWLREIMLISDNLLLSFARVTVPLPTYNAYKTKFDTLGERMIGEHFLYQENKVNRSSFEFAKINADHNLYPKTIASLNQDLLARRSVFEINHHPLLIAEVLLPDLVNLIK